MTVKALKKQLMAAIAMVVVSAIALSSSTYAWFANNTSVTAKAMAVNATSDSILLQIKGTDDNDFGTIGTTTLNQTTMKPVTSANGKNFGKLASTVTVTDAGNSKATWTGSNGAFQTTDLVEVRESDDDYATYVATAAYQLYCGTGTVEEVYVKNITISGTDRIDSAIRVSITVGESTMIFNPNNGSYNSVVADTVTYAGAGLLTGSTWSLAAPAFSSVGSYEGAPVGAVGTTPVDVTVRIWFDGQDTGCFTNNTNVEAVNCTIEFATNSTSVS